MTRLVVFGSSLRVGGGVSILKNFVERLVRDEDVNNDFDEIIIFSPHGILKKPNNEKIHLKSTPRLLNNTFGTFVIAYLFLPIYLRYFSKALLFNLGDTPILTSKKQAILFDWPYLLYPESECWNRMRHLQFLKRYLKKCLILTFSAKIDLWLAQTFVAANRLQTQITGGQIKVVPNAVSSSKNELEKQTRAKSSHEFENFYYITAYYEHKNLEILLDVAQKIKNTKSKFKIVLTLDPDNTNSNKLLKDIENKGLSSIIVNYGKVEYENLSVFYKNVDTLLMPSLLESFSSAYIEAMKYGKAIITSDLDFAHEVCQNAALYVQPRDASKIFDAMVYLTSNPEVRNKLVTNGKVKLANFPDWDIVYKNLMRKLKDL